MLGMNTMVTYIIKKIIENFPSEHNCQVFKCLCMVLYKLLCIFRELYYFVLIDTTSGIKKKDAKKTLPVNNSLPQKYINFLIKIFRMQISAPLRSCSSSSKGDRILLNQSCKVSFELKYTFNVSFP